jgi:hypothetical protein
MVKRYTYKTLSYLGCLSDENEVEVFDGEYVLYSDYQALREALREALDGWALLSELIARTGGQKTKDAFPAVRDRISQLRSLYLGGGETPLKEIEEAVARAKRNYVEDEEGVKQIMDKFKSGEI